MPIILKRECNIYITQLDQAQEGRGLISTVYR